jgi:uncharacterized coiled-coil DUF342 family protein
LPFKASLAQF